MPIKKKLNLETENLKQKSNLFSLNKLWIGIFIVIVLFAFISNIPQQYYKKFLLDQAYQKITTLEKNGDFESLYEFLTPLEKNSLSKEEFVRDKQTKAQKIYSRDYYVNETRVDGDRGIVDRTVTTCLTPECTGKDKIVLTGKKEYFFINGGWYFGRDNNIFCERKELYVIPEEFKRALSLVIQRFEQGNTSNASDSQLAQSWAKDFKSIQNCLDVQYALSEDSMNGAEGLFTFDRDSNKDRLRILVSPKYQAKDDLLTALLLSHEMTHAFYHASSLDTTLSCYQNEANAFTNEVVFLYVINEEERNSLNQRITTTPEVESFAEFLKEVSYYQGKYTRDKIKQYVMNDKYYQKQCYSDPLSAEEIKTAQNKPVYVTAPVNNQQTTQASVITHDGSRTGPIVDYPEFCAGGNTIKIYENEKMPYYDYYGKLYYLTIGDIRCYEKRVYGFTIH